MKLQQLEFLVAVVEHGSIRAAARHLHISQAAVTKAMRMLEEEAGVPLLLRRSRGIDLTDAGRRLVARARVITRQVLLVREDFRQNAGDDTGNLRIGVTPFVTLSVLGEAFHWFRQRYRNVQVEFVDGLIQRVLPRMREGSLDLAIVVTEVGEVLGEEFRAEPLQRIQQRIAVRRGHPTLPGASPAELVQYDWISTRPMGATQLPWVSAMFVQAGVSPPERVIVCDGLQALSLLRGSDALSIMPQPLLGNLVTWGIVALDNTGLHPPELELIRLTRPDVPLTPAAEYFAHCIAETIRNAKLL